MLSIRACERLCNRMFCGVGCCGTPDHYPRLSSAAFHLHGDPALAAELAIQRQLESMVAAMRESLYRDVYQAVKRDVLEVVETHVQVSSTKEIRTSSRSRALIAGVDRRR